MWGSETVRLGTTIRVPLYHCLSVCLPVCLSVCPSVCMKMYIVVCVQVLSTTFLGPHLDETSSSMSHQLLNQLDNFDK